MKLSCEEVRAEREITIVNRLGLHARAAARFVETAARFDSTIHICREGTSVDARSIMGLLMLAAPRGTRLTLRASGPDAERAVAALAELVARGFDEELPGHP